MPSYVRGRQARTLTDAQIIDLYNQGLDGETVAYRAGCCSATVLAIVRAAGHPIRARGKRGTPTYALKIEQPEIIRRYRNGESGPAIGRIAGCPPWLIYKMLRSAGVIIRRDALSASRAASATRQRNQREQEARR